MKSGWTNSLLAVLENRPGFNPACSQWIPYHGMTHFSTHQNGFADLPVNANIDDGKSL